MSRYIRYQSVVSRQADEPIGEDHWLNQFQKSLQKGAVQPRTQESLFDQINSIMNGSAKSKFPSVEAAVQDMKERSGLAAYLDKQSQVDDVHTTKTASVDNKAFYQKLKELVKSKNWQQLGAVVGQHDKINGRVVKAAESIVFFHYYDDTDLKLAKIPVESWHEYTLGYGEGAGLSDVEKKKDYDFTTTVLDIKKNKTKTASDTNHVLDKKIDMTPIVVKKYPPVMKTLENYIRDTKGNLPVPAIIEKIKSIHRSDCSDAKDWDDDKLIRLVSKLNLGAKKNNPDSYSNYSNLGTRDTGSNSDIDPSNTDAFFALTPVKM